MPLQCPIRFRPILELTGSAKTPSRSLRARYEWQAAQVRCVIGWGRMGWNKSLESLQAIFLGDESGIPQPHQKEVTVRKGYDYGLISGFSRLVIGEISFHSPRFMMKSMKFEILEGDDWDNRDTWIPFNIIQHHSPAISPSGKTPAISGENIWPPPAPGRRLDFRLHRAESTRCRKRSLMTLKRPTRDDPRWEDRWWLVKLPQIWGEFSEKKKPKLQKGQAAKWAENSTHLVSVY